MNAPGEDDASGVSQKFIFSWSEEKGIRRRLIASALFFDLIAVALALALCIGGWTKNDVSFTGDIISGDTHLVTVSQGLPSSSTFPSLT